MTTGSVHDAKVIDHLIREEDRAVLDDEAYVNERKKRAARAAGIDWAVKEKPEAGQRLSSAQQKRNHGMAPSGRGSSMRFGY